MGRAKSSFEYQNNKSRSSSLYNTTSFYPLAALALAACGGGGGGSSPTPQEPDPDPDPNGGGGNGNGGDDPAGNAPVLTPSGSQTLTLTEEETIAADTATGYTVTATDDDGDDVSFTVTGDARFAIVNNELVVVAGSVFDYEATANPGGVITLTITATDDSTGLLTDTQDVTITITDAPEAPVLSVGGSQTLTLNEEETITAGTATGYTVTATDGDGDTVSFSVDDARFTIDASGTLNITANSIFDFETESSITLTITATDNSNEALETTQDVTVTITNVDFSTILSEVSLSGGSEPRSTPAFGDVDGDGDMDLLIGERSGILNFYRWGTATDTAEAPGSGWTEQNAALTGNLAALATDFGFLTGPGFADVDGDGDMDLLVGKATETASGEFGQDLTVDYLRWDGTTTGWTAQTAPDPLDGNVITPNLGFNVRATPAYGDVDGDGDNDLLFGSFTGDLQFYRWGTDSDTEASPGSGWTAPVDDAANAATLTALGFSGIPQARTAPAFGDVDGDGDMDLLVGGGNFVAFYRWGTATDTAASPGTGWGGREPTAGYPAGLDGISDTVAQFSTDPAPAFGDVDGDGDMDLVIGQRDGTLDIYYRLEDDTWSQTSDII